MKEIMVNTKDLVLYFDGSKFYSGEIQENKYGERVFVNRDECFGVWLNNENTNSKIKLSHSSVLLLNELIEEDLCDEINAEKLEGMFGFDSQESQFLVKMHNAGEMNYLHFIECLVEFSSKVTSRIKNKEASKNFEDCCNKYFGEQALENE